jgi:hypothetical protein
MIKQGMHGQGSNGHAGYSGTTLLLAFLGGALTGAAVAYLAQADNRARVRAFANRTRQQASQLPQAVREASRVAKEAFTEAFGGQAGAAELIGPQQQQ